MTALVMTSLGISPVAAAPGPSTFTGGSQKAESTRYIVKFAAGTDATAGTENLRSRQLSVGRTFSKAMHGAEITATAAQADELRRSGQISDVEIDAPLKLADTQVSPSQWGLDRIDQRALPLSGSYSPVASGAGVSAYVIDSGVLASHNDFGGRVGGGWTAISDGQGTSDCNGHGTHVAGIIAGETYGVAKAASIIPVRVVDCTGSGYTSDLIAGLDWVAANHVAGTPAVANLSIGGPVSSMVDSAVEGLVADGVTAIIAAGNASADACNTSPARVGDALTVAASDSSDQQASFSNFGPCVDLYAPGVGITSDGYSSASATAVMSGTSMAAPHVAGAAAVLLSLYPQLTPAAVGTLLLSEATPGKVSAVSAGTPNRLLFSEAASPDSAQAATAITEAAASAGIGPNVGVMVCGASGAGCNESFQGGVIYWSRATGAHISAGAIRGAWGAQGYENGGLGYPTSNEIPGPSGGVAQSYQGGVIYWSQATGAHISSGAIRRAWGGQGYERGRLGYPTSNEYSTGSSSVAQNYQGGRILWSQATGAAISYN